MARLLPRSTYIPRVQAQVAYRQLVLRAAQYMVIAGIALYVVIALVNTIFGVPAAEAPYQPYGGS
jgi:hypothetical protein